MRYNIRIFMSIVAITNNNVKQSMGYVNILESMGATPRVITPQDSEPLKNLMHDVSAILLGDGPSICASFAHTNAQDDHVKSVDLDEFELNITRKALDLDLPILAIGRGLHILNICQGGKAPLPIEGHSEYHSDSDKKLVHTIYLSPGAKASAVIGSAGFFRVNSNHTCGIREIQRSPKLMSTAYSVEDGIIEALESPEHSWVIGFQCNPELQDQVPRSFSNLFLALVERSGVEP